MKKYLPSKKFIKFLSIALAIIIIFFSLSFFYNKKSVFNNRSEGNAYFDGSINFYTMDSDGDGVYDWEESLWGLNSKDPKSNSLGISDKEFVESQRKKISEEYYVEEKTDENLSRTDVLARQFLSTAAILRENGGLDQRSMEVFSKSFDETFSNTEIKDSFSLKDIKISFVSPAKYKESLAKIFDPLIKSDIEELGVIERVLSGDSRASKDIDNLVGLYMKLTDDLLKTETPENLATLHLSMINNAQKLSVIFLSVKAISTDPVSTMIGFSRYEQYSGEFLTTLETLDVYFRRNGII